MTHGAGATVFESRELIGEHHPEFTTTGSTVMRKTSKSAKDCKNI